MSFKLNHQKATRFGWFFVSSARERLFSFDYFASLFFSLSFLSHFKRK